MASTKRGVGKVGLNTVVGAGSVLDGEFEVNDGIRVDGTLKGQLTTSGTLVVGPSGQVEADPVRVKDAVIAGRLVGKLEASNQVKLEASATLVGDITARVIIIEEGAAFHGTCDAGEDAGAGVPAEELQPEPIQMKRVVG